tara:strand:+ start:257 stop:499 length:243 start_codon:yes stop_codon:yes gene_type:complete
VKNRRGAGFEIRQSVLWLVSDGVGEEDVNVLLAIVRARLAAKKSRSSFAKEKVWNFIEKRDFAKKFKTRRVGDRTMVRTR